ncbi:MAG: hypothetical protein ACRD29_14865 [Acidimicrobiales bacterium]
MKHRIRRAGVGASRERSWGRRAGGAITATVLLASALVGVLAGAALADPRMTVNLTPLAGAETVPAGDNLSYTGFLECSIPEGCQGVEITFTPPSAASGEGTLASPVPPDIDSWSVQPDGSILALADNIVAGRSIQLTVSWPTVNYYTAPGSYPITMSVTAVNDDGTPSADDAAVAVTAAPNPAIEKVGPAEIGFGVQMTYIISASNNPPAGQVRGTLALENPVLVDQLPAGTTFVSAAPDGAVYDPATHTVTWDNIDTDPDRPGRQLAQITQAPNELRFSITVEVDAPSGDVLTNVATMSCNPFGDPDTPVEFSDDAETVVDGGGIGASFSKFASVTQAADGQEVATTMVINNTGASSVDGVVVDTIPNGYDPISISLSQRDVVGPWPGAATFIIRRADGSESTHTYNQRQFNIPNGTLAEVTEVEIRPVDIPAGTALATRLVGIVDASELPGGEGVIENCADILVTDDDEELRATRCTDFLVVPNLVRAVISKLTDQTPVGPTGTHVWQLGITNDPTSNNSPPLRAYIVDRLPGELDYVADSWTLIAGEPDFCPTADQFTITWEPAEYPADGRLVIVAAPDALIPGNASTCEYEFRTTVKPGMASGVYGGNVADPDYEGNIVCLFDADNPLASPIVDEDDCDEDGDTTEGRGFAGDDFAIAESAGLFLFKEVKGDQDPEFLAAPEFPATDPAIGTSAVGGVVDWRLTVGNLTNKDLIHVVVYDILPAPGTPGVTSGRLDDPLVSDWRPTLTGPIDPAGAPVVITYSTNLDPCRPELDNTPDNSAPFFCDGVVPPPEFVPAGAVGNWSEIRSVRFDFEEEVFAGGETYTFAYRMQVPTVEGDGSPFEGGEITWNKSAGHADRLEPDGEVIPLLATEPAWVAAVVFVAPQPPQAPPKTPRPGQPGQPIAKTGMETGDYLFAAMTMIAFGVLLNVCGRQRRLAIEGGYAVTPARRHRRDSTPRP